MNKLNSNERSIAVEAAACEHPCRMSSTRKRWKQKGITLIELLIVVVIVGVLASVAYPSYLESSRKSRRSDAKIALVDLASRLERYYSENNTFATATIASNPSTDVLSSASSPDGHYTLSITSKSATTFTINATIASGGGQVGDAKCGNFSLTNTGLQTVSGTESASYCW